MRGFRQALAWASAQPNLERRVWQVARSLCANNGRFIARSALVGIHEPELLERHIAVRGAEHLASPGRGTILLGFHLGPRNSYLALRVAGHALTWVGGQTASGGWSRAITDRYQRPYRDVVHPSWVHVGSSRARVHLLYRARQSHLEGGRVFISADGVGTEAFSVPLPGGPMAIRSGWLTLRRATGAPVLPVLSHMEGRVQIVTVHPALPALTRDPVLDLEACRRALGEVLGEYVRRFPEQCPTLAFARRSSLYGRDLSR
jgi:hypothetical protein